jgi:hypothetical protein
VSRPRKTTRGKKVVEGLPFTAETVAHLLKDAGVEAALVDAERLATVLNRWRRLADAERAAIPFRQAHRRFAEVLLELHREIVPVVRQEMLDLSRMAIEPSAEAVIKQATEAVIKQATEAVIALDLLKHAIELCGQQAPLTHIEPHIAGVARWQDFAELIERLLVDAGASRRAAWRFISAVTPQLTGEAAPALTAVATRLKRHRLLAGRGHLTL